MNISTAPILKTQDLIMTIMMGYIVHSKATNQVRQAVRPRHQVPRQAVRPRHQVPHQAVRPRLQVQATQAVATSNAKYGKRDGETAQLATRTEEGIAVIVMGEEVTTLAITIMSVAFVEEQALAQCAEAEENTRRLTARGSKTLTIKVFIAKIGLHYLYSNYGGSFILKFSPFCSS